MALSECVRGYDHRGVMLRGLVGILDRIFSMNRIFRGKKTGNDRIVEDEQNGCTELLPLVPSLEIADHSPDGFNWGITDRGPLMRS